MSGLCGWVGQVDPAIMDLMLGAIAYRGDRTDVAFAPGVALGYRWWGDRPGKAPGIHKDGPHCVAVAGTFAPPAADPAATLRKAIAGGLDVLDGAFAGAWWDGEANCLSLIRDPFGVRSLYYVEFSGVFYFASELKQLLAIPGLPVELDPVVLHKYLTFSFVPGEAVPIQGVRRLLPGHILTLQHGKILSRPYFTLKEEIDPALADVREATMLVRARCHEAVARRLNGEAKVGLFLSGGVDSSAIALWLKQAGVDVSAFTLDFGAQSVELAQAEHVARHLAMPLTRLPVSGAAIGDVLMDLVWKLDLPFGDAVTGPQYLLGRAARDAGITAVFNGEGGDQFFGGWTSKPMVAAALYAPLFGGSSIEEHYLESYHRFYGLEEALYTPDFQAQVGGPGQRRAHLQPYLHDPSVTTFLNHVRLADIALKGSQNILPRAERMANAWGIDVRVPLFDRALAEASFRLPPGLKLHGACEKYVLKRAVAPDLPKEIVWRRKFGMSVPITDWVLGPLAPLMSELLSPAALARRGLFRSEYISRLLAGQGEALDTRRRRVGERVWALAMLEAWLRVFVDGRGKDPGGRRQ